MRKYFIETSVFIRFFTKDDAHKFEDCEKLFDLIEKGLVKSYSSNVVIQEIFYVLTKTYGFNKTEVLEDIKIILKLRNMTLIETTDTPKALEFFEKYNIKFGDCFIASQLPYGTNLVTYDKDFSKIKSLEVVTPKEVTS